MAVTYLPMTCQLIGTPADYDTVHARIGDGFQYGYRPDAHAYAFDELGHDDFRIATIVDGKLAGIGWGPGDTPDSVDFDPDEEGLAEIAAQLGLDLADVDQQVGRTTATYEPGGPR
jgi:hypothetical protein